MTTAETQNHRGFGKVVAALRLEDRILADGVLPKRRLAERSQVVEGIVDGLLEKGDWRKALSLVFVDGSAKALYDGDKAELIRRIGEAIKPEDFKYDHREGVTKDRDVELLVNNGGADVVYNFALRDDLDHHVALYFLRASKNVVGDDRWKDGVSIVAKHIQNEYPAEVYELFTEIGDRDSIEALYQRLLDAFSLDNVQLLLKLAERGDEYRGERKGRKKAVVHKALNAEGREQCKIGFDGGLGKYLYTKLIHPASTPERATFYVDLDEADRNELERLAALHIGRYDLRNQTTSRTIFTPLELLWARLHWAEEPVFAYRLFLEKEYEGEEVVPCAKAAFERIHGERTGYHGDRETVELKSEHVKAFYGQLPRDNLKLREIAARQLNNRGELLALAQAWKDKKEFRWAYDLGLEAGLTGDDRFVVETREKLYRDEMVKARKLQMHPSFYWLRKEDVVGYELIYGRLIRNRPGLAFKLAADRNNTDRVERARTRVLKRNSPEAALDFFAWERDQVGYDGAAAALATKYSVPLEQLQPLLPGIRKD